MFEQNYPKEKFFNEANKKREIDKKYIQTSFFPGRNFTVLIEF